MKIIKNSLRAWFAVASVFSFLGGWILLAHANKPAPLQVNQPAITAPAHGQTFRSFSSNSGTSFAPFTIQSQPSFFTPRLRTGGS